MSVDELGDFSRKTLDPLRQSVEDKKVSVARGSGTYTYSENFMFITATNPCTYGYYLKSCCINSISFDDQIIMNIHLEIVIHNRKVRYK